MNHSPDWQIRIDTGGTFTDCIGRDPQGVTHRCKVLSSGALKGKVLRWSSDHELVAGQEWNAPDGFINGSGLTFAGRSETFRVVHFDAARSAIRLDRPHPFPPDHPGSAFQVHTGEEAPILGARLMTRTLPGQALPSIRMRLATTKGTNALLERKGSPVLFLITAGFGDLLRIGDQQRKDLFALQIQKTEPLSAQILEVPERIDTHGSVLRQLDLNGFGPRLDRMIGELKQQ